MRVVVCLIAVACVALVACSPEEPAAPAIDPAPIAEPADAPLEPVLQDVALTVEPLPPRPAPRPQAEAGPVTLDRMLARAERGFDRADADADGVVSTTELEAAAEILPNARSWSRADRDADGRLTREEFRSVVAWRFQRMDADDDGQVNPAERQALRGGDAD